MKEFLMGMVRFFHRLGLELEGSCPVHHAPLQRGEARVRYGLIRYSDDYIASRYAQFPWANTVINGGCVVADPENLTETRVTQYCQQCRDNESNWLDSHPDARATGRA